MARHHIVQDKYLVQWRKSDTENQLNIYVIPTNEFIEKGSGWQGFWKEDFNVLNDEDGKSDVPEKLTAVIDTEGIDAVKSIDVVGKTQLEGLNRCYLSFYISLQYIRTPRYREETDKIIKAEIEYWMKKDISSPEKVSLSKKEILATPSIGKHDEEIKKWVSTMSEDEIKSKIFEQIQNEDIIAGLTKTGHSKGILKVDGLAKELFECQWIFMTAPKGTSYITSDNPCFTISNTKIMNGLLSPNSIVIFPLRPDVCIFIKPKLKSKTEHYLQLNKKEVKSINKLILENSYQCVVAKEKKHLESVVKGYDHKRHRKSRDAVVREKGYYTIFSIE
jgi:hypothetical protein